MNCVDNMIRMAAMSKFGKTCSKIISITSGPIAKKLYVTSGIQALHRFLDYDVDLDFFTPVSNLKKEVVADNRLSPAISDQKGLLTTGCY